MQEIPIDVMAGVPTALGMCAEVAVSMPATQPAARCVGKCKDMKCKEWGRLVHQMSVEVLIELIGKVTMWSKRAAPWDQARTSEGTKPAQKIRELSHPAW